jgi:hypothetical protein
LLANNNPWPLAAPHNAALVGPAKHRFALPTLEVDLTTHSNKFMKSKRWT